MTERHFLALLNALWRDSNTVEFYWLVAALVGILANAWWISILLHHRRSAQTGARPTLRDFGAGSVRRIAPPLIALVQVVVLHHVLIELGVGHLAVLDVASLLLASWTLVRFLVYVLRSVFPLGGFLRSFERLVTFAIWGGMVLEITGLSETVVGWLEQLRFSVGKQNLDAWMVLHGTVTVGATLLGALWFAALIERRLQAAEQLDANVREVLGRLARALLSLIALLLSLSFVGIDVTALSVFSGALAVGLGFGLQKIASNYVSGFIILLDRSIRLGNLVCLDDKTTGTVTRITTRYTVLRTLTGTEVIIPNEYLISNMVRNLSFSDSLVRVATTVSVAYDTEIERAMALMVEIARAHPRVLKDPAPGVLLTAFAENGIDLELGFWIADPEVGTGGVRSEINLEILRAFRREGIEIPFPQREVRILPATA